MRSMVQRGLRTADEQKRSLGRRRSRTGGEDGPGHRDHRSWKGSELRRRPRPASDSAQNSSNVRAEKGAAGFSSKEATPALGQKRFSEDGSLVAAD